MRSKKKKSAAIAGSEQSMFAESAQAALDSSVPAPAPPRDAGYRRGVALSGLMPGECGDVHHLIGSTQGRLRLMEMGLTPGVHVHLVRAAAFGGPLVIVVRGYQLSLRRDEADAVWLDDSETDAE